MSARRRVLLMLALVGVVPRAGRCDDPDSLPALTVGTAVRHTPSVDALQEHTAQMRQEIPAEVRDAALVLAARLREYLPVHCRLESRRDARGMVDSLTFRVNCEQAETFALGAFEVRHRATQCGPGRVAGSPAECIGLVIGDALRATPGCHADIVAVGFADRTPVTIQPGTSWEPGAQLRAAFGAPAWTPLLAEDLAEDRRVDPSGRGPHQQAAQDRLSWSRPASFYAAIASHLGPVPGEVRAFVAGLGTAYQDNLEAACQGGGVQCAEARRIVVFVRLRPATFPDDARCGAAATPIGALRCEEATHRAHAVRSTIGGIANGVAPLTRSRQGDAIPMCWSNVANAQTCEWLDRGVLTEAATPPSPQH